ncbi:hypothetical protein [Halochromatium glycolicum]|uniref:Uncharacterized protein n=1 Tax=Halochromatium glycolicum TaxID=85075 RepID=A0AAJ0U3Z1_9GAMM|nr:hypothetical protein [Halochromatium glycolicum]MBK1704858.1 hypothetical protein [Halochromatium glycolicum]
MILKAIIDEQVYTLNVPDPVIERGGDFFDQLDRDMDQGWQMSREWVEAPNRLQRCQIIADKLLTALEKENEKLGMLMAGYILDRLPNVETVELDVQGEIQNNQFSFRDQGRSADTDLSAAEQTPVGTPAAEPEPDEAETGSAMPAGLDKIQAMTQAGQDVTQVFKVGKAYRFSVYDHDSGSWQDSPLIANQPEAERLRQEAFKARYEALQRG